MIGIVAEFFGISVLRLVIYLSVVVAIIIAGLTIRQHYINLGWDKALAKVEKQDARAATVAKQARQKADDCEANSYWDVITKSCKTEDAE